jgi:hypothetical protein
VTGTFGAKSLGLASADPGVPQRTPQEPKVLCVCARDSLRRRVTRALLACGAVPRFANSTAEAITLCTVERYRVLLLDIGADDNFDARTFKVLASSSTHGGGPAPPILLVSRVRNEERLLSILEHVEARNLIATHERSGGEAPILDEHELIVTCHKLLCRDLFGMAKYLSFVGAHVYEIPITGAQDRDAAVDLMIDFARRLELGPELEDRIATITDELVTNAVYNAPRLADGTPRYAHVDRRQKIRLEPHEYARLQYGCDGRYLALSVTDFFGSLRGETVASYLRKCFRRGDDQIDAKSGGAGLGIYMTFNSVTQLVFNLAAGRKTEVIALFYIRSEARGFRRSGRSLNVFIEEG